jgi:HEAT repeat protein
MIQSLQNFHLDRPSFWLGFVAGALLWWILASARPLVARLRQALRARAQAAREQLLASVEIRHGNDILRLAQGLHIAAPLFALDEVLVEPHLLAPLPPGQPDGAPLLADITELVLPYLPDWPELASMYGTPTLSLVQALEGGCHLAIIGQPGSGKTVALAALASQFVRKQGISGELARRVPFLVHSADLILPSPDPLDLLKPLYDAVALHASPLTLTRLPGFLKTAFEESRALLLLDGLDELPQAAIQEIVAYLGQLVGQYPSMLAVVTASPAYFDGLTALGFMPLTLAVWSEQERSSFINRWGERWTSLIETPSVGADSRADPLLLNNWLLGEQGLLTPLELTLKVWAAYASDLLGPTATDAIEAHLRRMTVKIPGGRLSLEHLAAQMVINQQTVVNRKEAEAWIAAPEKPEPVVITLPDELGQEEPISKPAPQPALGSLSALAESNLLVTHIDSRLSVTHPVFTSYLAASAVDGKESIDALLAQPEWTGKTMTLQSMVGQRYGHQPSADADWVTNQVQDVDTDPLLDGLFLAARCLRAAPQDVPWGPAVLRALASCFQNQTHALGLRGRAMAALATLNNSGVNVLFRQSLTSPSASQRWLAALGCGAVRDTKVVGELVSLLGDVSLTVRQAACLALVAIGDKAALEAVATTLLQGDEDLRKAAAEALANHLEEGQPTLEEGSGMEDLMVRRAATFGLGRVHQPWAIELLYKMQIEDNQWVVKNAASQVLDELDQPNPRIPRRLPQITEAPWLIAFAAGKGIGVAPGKPALDLVMQTLNEGSLDQVLAALEYIGRTAESGAITAVYKVYFSGEDEVRQAALDTLWLLARAGIPLPQPIQFGYHS